MNGVDDDVLGEFQADGSITVRLAIIFLNDLLSTLHTTDVVYGLPVLCSGFAKKVSLVFRIAVPDLLFAQAELFYLP